MSTDVEALRKTYWFSELADKQLAQMDAFYKCLLDNPSDALVKGMMTGKGDITQSPIKDEIQAAEVAVEAAMIEWQADTATRLRLKDERIRGSITQAADNLNFSEEG